MTELFVDYDTDVWIEVPLSYPLADFDTPEQWVDAAVLAIVPDDGDDDGLGEPAWRDMLGECAQLALTTNEPLLALLLHVADDESLPLPVYVCLTDSDDPVSLTELVAIERPGAVELPIVESFETETLGQGLRTLRYTADAEDGALAATLRYGFLVEGAGPLLVWTATPQLERLHACMNDLDDLVRAIRPDTAEPSESA